jgi:hypothetical protein
MAEVNDLPWDLIPEADRTPIRAELDNFLNMYMKVEIRDPPSPPVVDHYWTNEERFNADFDSAIKMTKETLRERPSNPKNPIQRFAKLQKNLRGRLEEQDGTHKGEHRTNLKKMDDDLTDKIIRYTNKWMAAHHNSV